MANEKRLIDANALIAYFKEQCEIASKDSEIESLYTLAALKCCIDYFEQFPTVDAVEVVNGRWIIDRERLIATCSECEHILRFSDEMQIVLLADNERFCYYCGAKMDGDGNA